jgi:hypothetical protein
MNLSVVPALAEPSSSQGNACGEARESAETICT